MTSKTVSKNNSAKKKKSTKPKIPPGTVHTVSPQQRAKNVEEALKYPVGSRGRTEALFEGTVVGQVPETGELLIRFDSEPHNKKPTEVSPFAWGVPIPPIPKRIELIKTRF